MAQLQELLKNEVVRNTALGVGLTVIVPVAVAALAPLVKPFARSSLKMGVLAWERGREVAAELAEIIDDMVAEVREELRIEREVSEGISDQSVAVSDKGSSKSTETESA